MITIITVITVITIIAVIMLVIDLCKLEASKPGAQASGHVAPGKGLCRTSLDACA